jgi:predicted acyltransferase
VFGNAIAAYIFSELLAILPNSVSVGENTLQEHIYASVFADLATPANASLLYALSYVMLVLDRDSGTVP